MSTNNSGNGDNNILFTSSKVPIQKSSLARSSPLTQDSVTLNGFNQNKSNLFYSTPQKNESSLSGNTLEHSTSLSSAFSNKLSIFDRAREEFLGELPPPPPRHRPIGAKHRSGSYSLSFLQGTNIASAFGTGPNFYSQQWHQQNNTTNMNSTSTSSSSGNNGNDTSMINNQRNLFNSNFSSNLTTNYNLNNNGTIFDNKNNLNDSTTATTSATTNQGNNEKNINNFDLDRQSIFTKKLDYLGLDDTTSINQRFNSYGNNNDTFFGPSIFDKPKLMVNSSIIPTSINHTTTANNDHFIPFPKKTFTNTAIGESSLNHNNIITTSSITSSANQQQPSISINLSSKIDNTSNVNPILSNQSSSLANNLPSSSATTTSSTSSNSANSTIQQQQQQQQPKPLRRSPFLYNTHQRSSSIAFLESQQTDVGPQPISTNVHRRIASFGGRKLEDELYGNGIPPIGINTNVPPANHSIKEQETEKQETKEEEKKEESLSIENEDYEINMDTPSKTLWIENVDQTIPATDIISPFAKYGEIEFMRLVPEKNGAFITFVEEEDSVTAKSKLKNLKIDNTPIKISYGRISLADPANDEKGLQPTKSLWIGNIPQSIGSEELNELFSKFGKIESARVLTHKNCGFVNFERLEDAIKAKIEMNGKDAGGTDLRINYAKVPPKGEQIITNSNSGNNAQTTTSKTKQTEESNSKSETSSTTSATTPTTTTETTINTTNATTTSTTTTSSKELPSITIPLKESNIENSTEPKVEYFSEIPSLPESESKRKIDQNKLREIRKKLDGNVSAKDIDTFYENIVDDTVELCTDYIGNVVIQKIIEKTNDQNKVLKLIELVAPYMASFGIHKNGTWVVQKMIDCAKTQVQIQKIINAIRPYTPPLLLDQFGNYVVQCCLRLGTKSNQFVFDAMEAKCLDIGQGRFGARSVRACLESQYTTKRQQKQIAIAIVQNSVQLCTNPNGAILLTWLLDTSSLPGRYRVLAPKLASRVPYFCCHKLASATILKLVNQRTEFEARDIIIQEIFYKDESKLEEILKDQIYGVSVIQKILSNGCINMEEKIKLADHVRKALSKIGDIKPNQVSYKRLLDELGVIPSNLGIADTSAYTPGSIYSVQDIVSPLTPTTPLSHFFLASSPSSQQQQTQQNLTTGNQTNEYFQGQSLTQVPLNITYPTGYISPQQNLGVFPFNQYNGLIASQNNGALGGINSPGSLSPINKGNLNTNPAQFAQIQAQANFFYPALLNQQQQSNLLSTSPNSQLSPVTIQQAMPIISSGANSNSFFSPMNQFMNGSPDPNVMLNTDLYSISNNTMNANANSSTSNVINSFSNSSQAANSSNINNASTSSTTPTSQTSA